MLYSSVCVGHMVGNPEDRFSHDEAHNYVHTGLETVSSGSSLNSSLICGGIGLKSAVIDDKST